MIPGIRYRLAAALFVLSASDLLAQAPAGDLFENLKFRSVGPSAGGRVARVTGIAGDPLTYYVASAAGGVWKSADGGRSFKPVFDDQPIASIGSIAVAPSDPNIVYAGSGEANIRGNVAPGNGIYKSLDAGKTWTRVWAQVGQIGALAIHPKNPDIAWAAVLGHAFGPNPERGVYKTSDGGKTWRRVLFKDENTGASDVTLDPANPNRVFAGLWQTRRRPWEMTSGGPGGGLHLSLDGGETWKQLSGKGLADGIWGKVGVRVAPSDPRRVYAIVEAEKGGLFRSEDGGENWVRASDSQGLRQRAWYYSTLTVDPLDANTVWLPQVNLLKTLDAGATVRSVKGGGWDYHDVWIDPANSKRMITGSDAGVATTIDGGETWSKAPLPIAQHYHVTVDRREPYWLYASAQDFGTMVGPSRNLANGDGISLADWHWAGGGEAGHIVADPTDPDIVYAGEYLGYMSRYDHRSRQARNVSGYPENFSGHGIEKAKVRFQWTAPILLSPHDPKTLYHAGNIVLRSRDGGQSWTPISPDLTRNDPAKQQWSGGPITGDNTGVEFYDTVFALAESPLEKGLLWAGSDDGLVHVSRDDGATWTNLTANLTGLPEWGTVQTIEPSPHDAATAYVVVDAHRLDDTHPYLWRTQDHGKTWKRLVKDLEPDVHLHVVREDPSRKGLVYLGTERGVKVSWDAGESWRALKLNLPTAAVHSLVVTPHDLVVGTMGRSIWIFDDLTPLRQWSGEKPKEAMRLLPVAPARRWRHGSTTAREGMHDNPPNGAILHYWLGAEVKDELVLEIRDAQNRLVRRLSSTPPPLRPPADHPDASPSAVTPTGLPRTAGLQRFVWDLRWDGAELIPDGMIDWGDPDVGPLAVPGRYTARLLSGGGNVDTEVLILPDPTSTVSAGDLESQSVFALEVRDAISRLARDVVKLRAVRDQLRGRSALLAKAPPSPAASAVSAQATALADKLDSIERRLHNPAAKVSYDILARGAQLYSRLSPLYSFATEGDGPPTQGLREVFAGQSAELKALEAELNEVFGPGLEALNRDAAQAGFGFVTVP